MVALFRFVSDALVRPDLVAQRTLAAGLLSWAAPDALVTAITRAAVITDRARVAAMLARLPRGPVLRIQLCRLAAAIEPRQAPLL